jgi:ABC-type proline/glycine betaine transport system permease subunit
LQVRVIVRKALAITFGFFMVVAAIVLFLGLGLVFLLGGVMAGSISNILVGGTLLVLFALFIRETMFPKRRNGRLK